MTRTILAILLSLLSASSLFAQTVNIRATDPSTGRSVQVGDQTNNAVRMRLVASDVPLAVSASSLPLPTGASTAANQATEITSLQLLDDAVFTLGTGTYAEATSKGYLISAVRRDADTTLVDTTNEMAPLQVNAAGQLKVACIVGCSSSGGSSLVDDAPFTVGTTSFTVIGGTYKSTRDAIDDNDGGAVALTPKRAVYATLETPNADSIVNETADSLRVTWYDTTGAAVAPDTLLTHDGSMTPGSTTGGAQFYYGSSTAPTVITTGRAVLPWGDLNGRLHLTGDASMSPLLVTGSGTAGSPAAGVVSIQGITSMTPILTSSAQSGAWTVGQSGSPWGVAGSLSNNNAAPSSNQIDVMPCVVGASAPSYTDGRSAKPRCGTDGSLYFNLANGSTTDTDDGTVSSGATNVAQTISVGYAYDGSNNTRLRAVAGAISGSSLTGLITRPYLPSDGTNVQPVGDAMARAIFSKTLPIGDGTLKSGGTSAMTGTTSTQVIAAVASNYLYIGSCSINNTHASVDTLVDLQDGSGGTVIWTFTAPHGYAGESHVFNPPLKVPTNGNGLYAVNATTGASVKVFCQGMSSTTSY